MFNLDLSGKKVLVIGSGADLNGRKMAAEIDNPDGKWDFVIRCNRYFGDPEDVGSRMDLLMVRYFAWRRNFPEDMLEKSRCMAIYEGGFTHEELVSIAEECNIRKASCGLLACWWALQMGAESVTVIGFGYGDGKWAEFKVYPDGTKDNNPMYDWDKEHEWMESHVQLI